jgi:hypothetical protein
MRVDKAMREGVMRIALRAFPLLGLVALAFAFVST